MLQGLFTKNEPTSSCIYLQHRYPCICLFKCGRCIYFSHICGSKPSLGAQLILDWNFQPGCTKCSDRWLLSRFLHVENHGGWFLDPSVPSNSEGSEKGGQFGRLREFRPSLSEATM